MGWLVAAAAIAMLLLAVGVPWYVVVILGLVAVIIAILWAFERSWRW